MAAWAFVLDGYDVSDALGQRVLERRNGPSEASFELSHDQPAAKVLLDTLTSNSDPWLRCYRDRVLRFHGPLSALSEQGNETQSGMVATFRGPFAGLQTSSGGDGGEFVGIRTEYVTTDAGQIAWGLIERPLEGLLPAYIGKGTIQATVKRDRTYERGAGVGEAIIALTTVEGGFDFWVEPIEPNIDAQRGLFHVYAQQGVDRPNVVFEYGSATIGNVTAYRRSVVTPIRKVTAYGANGMKATAAGGGGGPPTQVISVPDVSVQATLQAIANGALRPRYTFVTEFDPDPAVAPQPWVNYFLGDTVRYRAKHGAYIEQRSVRIDSIEVQIDDNGNESAHKLTFA